MNVKLKRDFICIKTKLTQNFIRLFVRIFQDRCLVHFCTACHEILQFIFFPFVTAMRYLKSVLSLVQPIFLRFTHSFLDKQNLLENDSATYVARVDCSKTGFPQTS